MSPRGSSSGMEASDRLINCAEKIKGRRCGFAKILERKIEINDASLSLENAFRKPKANINTFEVENDLAELKTQ